MKKLIYILPILLISCHKSGVKDHDEKYLTGDIVSLVNSVRSCNCTVMFDVEEGDRTRLYYEDKNGNLTVLKEVHTSLISPCEKEN